MKEEAVFVCSWARSRTSWKLWLKKRPRVVGEGSTYGEAQAALVEAVIAARLAMIPILEFDKPLPKNAGEERFSEPELYTITGDDRFETDAPPRNPDENAEQRDERLRENDSFYQTPVCRTCFHSTRPRSERALTLGYAPADDGAFGSVGAFEAGNSIKIVSQEFLDLLTSKERDSLELRPVQRSRGRRQFFELVGPVGPPHVGVRGWKVSGRRCVMCGYRTFGYWLEGLSIRTFVAKADLPHPLPGIFTVGASAEVELCVTAKRWQKLVGQKGTRGFVSSPLGVVSDQDLLRVPELPVGW